MVVKIPMGVHASQRCHRKDGDQKERQEMHRRSRGAWEEKERGRNAKREEKERKEMKGVWLPCRDRTPFYKARTAGHRHPSMAPTSLFSINKKDH
jgi:hypothetical protein